MKLLAITFALIATVYGQWDKCETGCQSDYQSVCGTRNSEGAFEWSTFESSCALELYNCQNNAKSYSKMYGLQDCAERFRTRNSAPLVLPPKHLFSIPNTTQYPPNFMEYPYQLVW